MGMIDKILSIFNLQRTEETEESLNRSGFNRDRVGKKWSKEEDQHIIKGFNHGIPANRLADNHGRTPGAIRARMVHLGLINDRRDYK